AQLTEWHNYTGFLSSLGGCCVNEKQIKNLINGIDGSTGPQEQSDMERYINEMVDLLVCESTYVRESVRETLGSELSPRLYIILFRHLESIVNRFFDTDGEVIFNDRYTTFVDQAITVLKLILERIQDSTEDLCPVDLGDL
ncbi:5773_t:CDS:1, partial [Acaulospora colombiana]